MKAKSTLFLMTLVMTFASMSFVFSQSVAPTKVITPVGFDVSGKLSDIEPGTSKDYIDQSWKETVVPNKDGFLEEFKKPSDWTGPDPVLQDYMTGSRSTSTIGQNFPGVSNRNSVAPPDTDGDVGPNHYMQMVNLSYQIWDKNGNSLVGPLNSSSIWDGFTGPWAGTNDGDPIVLYDQYADRWLASQFSLPNYPNGPWYELVAVSVTGDPTGAWYRYAYTFDDMPDYPKFGVWPDGYYFTINQFASGSLSWAGGGVCVLNRDKMIAGDPNAEMQFFDLGTGYGSLLPADADGSTLPPTGSPNYLMNLGSNSLRLWEASIDWNNSSNSSISLVQTIGVNSFSYSGIIINQPGTSQTLDQLASRLMFRLQYRNFGTHEVLLTNHTVNANGSGQAGVRWYEFRNTGSGWGVHQQGTFAPADGDNRWMGSVAMNGNGDIAIGYSVSSSSTYPSIRFAGQTAASSGTGVLDVTENSIKEGTASQTGVNRWGDYSMMSVDPSDDQTFWYTSEYSSGGWNWKTQVASFSFEPPVVIAPVAEFSGNPTSVMEGQTVSFTDQSQNNPTSWNWTFEGGVPSTSSNQNPVVTYPSIGTYNVSLSVSNSAGSDAITKTGYITVTEYSITYCPSYGTNTSLEYIDVVQLGTNYNSSGDNGGYGDYTDIYFSVESGQTYNLDLVPVINDRNRREFWRVWIDYNKDGDFDDTGETVFVANNKKSAVSGIISIPSGLTGETMMRITLSYGSSPSSCDVFTYGEVEDYTLVFGTPPPQPPVADFSAIPTTVVVGNTVAFTDQSQNNPASWSWSFAGGTPATSTDQNPVVAYNTVGLFAVSLTVANNEGEDTKTVIDYITVTEEGTTDYCSSASLSNALEYISDVQIGTFNKSSGASLYSDFTGDIIGLAAGSTYNVALTPTFTGRAQREFWRIWIDYNGNGSFEDAGEQVFVANNKKDVATGSFTVPVSVSGQTRLRVTMKNGGSPLPCETFNGGEVEDYTVNFGSQPLEKDVLSEFDMSLYPNPAEDVLNVKLISESADINIKVYNAFGVIMQDFNIKGLETQLDLSNLPTGIYYVGAENEKQTTLKKFIKN